MSRAKHAGKALLLENVHPRAVEALEDAGFTVETRAGSLTETELIKQLEGVTVVGIRSATKVTRAVLEQAPGLIAVGAFCIGTNQIDLEAAAKHGVAVFNAPYANTRSVVELTMGEIIMLARRLPERNADMHAGAWDKSAAGSFEVRGKTLGIVGYGNIGSQLSVLAESAGMQVCFYDIADKLVLGNAVRCRSLRDLLERSDVVTLHVDGRPSNRGLFGASEIALMKDGALLINNSRGFVVDTDAVAAALASGKLGGVAADVFPEEPEKGQPFDSPLRAFKNTVLTPHIGGSTAEAQLAIAEFVSRKLQRYGEMGDTTMSVNLPQLRLAPPESAYRLAYVHQNVPGVLAKLNGRLTKSDTNIVGQYLATSGPTGYVVVDAEKPYTAANIRELSALPETIKLRVLPVR